MEFNYTTLALILLIWNLITFAVMGIDKRKSVKNKKRISESTLLLLAFLLGSLGVITAMFIFHHKTKKPLFIITVPIAIAINVLAVVGVITLMR